MSLDQLQTRLDTLRLEFTGLSMGKTQCQIGRERTLNKPLKQTEGRMQLMTDLLRCLKKGGFAKLAECLLKVRLQWEALPESSEEWLAYKQAALEELGRVSDQFLND